MHKMTCDIVRKISEMPSAALVALDKAQHQSYIGHRDSCDSCGTYADEQVAKKEIPLPPRENPASDRLPQQRDKPACPKWHRHREKTPSDLTVFLFNMKMPDQ